MKLTAETLRAIADMLDRLAEVPGQVSQVKVHGLTVHVRQRDPQRDGSWYEVTRIEGLEG